jgi:predicted MFS family arabinose efflux permease
LNVYILPSEFLNFDLLGRLVEQDQESAGWNEFRAGWRVLLVSVLGVMVSVSVVPIYAIGAFVKPLQLEFGWSRGAIQYALTAYFLGALFAAVLCGWLLRRFEVRTVAIGSLFGNALGFMLMSRLNASIWSLYAGMFALIILGAGTMSATWTLATSYWFVRHRGLALAVILSGSGLASALAPLYATALTQAYGWRIAFIGLGLPSLLLALPAVVLLLPRGVPLPHTAPVLEAGAPGRTIPGMSLRAALRSWRLWVLGVGLMLVVMGILGLIPNLIPLLTDAGLSGTQAASLAGLIGASLTVSRLGSGYLIDRLWAPGVAAVLLSAPAISCAILLSGMHGHSALALVVVLIGIGTGAENDIAAYLSARYFGLREYGAVFSAVTMIITAGNMLCPLIFGYLYNSTGSYDGMLWTCAGLFIAGSGLLLTLGKYPRFD